jgi:hypothetical protein
MATIPVNSTGSGALGTAQRAPGTWPGRSAVPATQEPSSSSEAILAGETARVLTQKRRTMQAENEPAPGQPAPGL